LLLVERNTNVKSHSLHGSTTGCDDAFDDICAETEDVGVSGLWAADLARSPLHSLIFQHPLTALLPLTPFSARSVPFSASLTCSDCDEKSTTDQFAIVFALHVYLIQNADMQNSFRNSSLVLFAMNDYTYACTNGVTPELLHT